MPRQIGFSRLPATTGIARLVLLEDPASRSLALLLQGICSHSRFLAPDKSRPAATSKRSGQSTRPCLLINVEGVTTQRFFFASLEFRLYAKDVYVNRPQLS